jgi:hypothetical protein
MVKAKKILKVGPMIFRLLAKMRIALADGFAKKQGSGGDAQQRLFL